MKNRRSKKQQKRIRQQRRNRTNTGHPHNYWLGRLAVFNTVLILIANFNEVADFFQNIASGIKWLLEFAK